MLAFAIQTNLLISTVIVLTYIYLYLRYRHRSIKFWIFFGIGYTLRNLLFFFQGQDDPFHIIDNISRQLEILNGIFIYYGFITFFEKKTISLKIFIPLAICLSVYYLLARQLGFGFIAENLPIFLATAAIFIYCGYIFLTESDFISGKIVGLSLLLWGIHKLDFPFWANHESFGPIGFIAASIINFILSTATILFYLEKNENRNASLSQELEVKMNEISSIQDYFSHNIRSEIGKALALLLPNPNDNEIKLKDHDLTQLTETMRLLDRSVRDLNDFIQLSVVENKPAATRYRLTEVANQALKEALFKYRIHDKDIDFRFSQQFPFGQTHIEDHPIEKKWLEVLLTQLFENSIRFKKPESLISIEISIDFTDSNFTIEYVDNSIGFDYSRVKEKIFDLHVRLDPQKSGKGFGLFIVKKIIDFYNGSIHITTKPNQGISIRLQIPRQKTAERAKGP